MSNPLLKSFDTPFQTAPFSKIKNKHFKPAFIEGIKLAKLEIDAITNNSEAPSFKNTIEALDFSGQTLDRISSIFFNLNSAETNDEIQKIAQEVSPMLSEFANDITLDEKLFKRIKTVYKKKDELNLTTEQDTLLTKKYKSFVRNGANLNEVDKTELRKIDSELSKLKLTFGENVLAETNAYELHLTNEDDLKGLPESAIEAAKMVAKQKNKDGWVFTLDYPSYIPFLTYADNRNLRKTMALAFGAKAFQNNENDNQQIILDLVKLRYKRANLLGYKTHAHFVLEERMAESPETVTNFLNDLLPKAKPAAEKEFKQLEALAKKDGVETLQKWDSAYYSEKLKKQLFDLDQEQLKPYFKLENVIEGVFTISNKLFDLVFEEINTIDKYHEDVKTYKVTDTFGNYIAILYADFFPREGKRNGAWMTSFKNQWIKDGENSRPHISIVCNFTKPTETKPSLLTFNEVTTLFHEFGHALHGMLANTTYPSLSGTNVFWDFVELPSQLLENWCYEKEALSLFAKHFETKELIPMDFITKIKKSSNFLEGMQTLRQLSFGILDLDWHGKNPSTITNVKEFETNSFKGTQLFPEVEENCMSTSFSHIFQGGYSSGYYSYKWAEVLDADAFEAFLENGIFDKGIALKFKTNILEKGGTEKPMKLYENFRGKKPTNNALLKRAGLLK
ncbi:peptidyl-dipeptidase Dcp [Lutibacter agarilyticus]|uniref:Peptidyl-dipeptidase Dcp n=1 Tax=Lutibacter agarilyticus TaxID=1109740 RepID=A0A238XSV5_9FLAO|nr:M3 family metallopeptidase [Lutibacter agarilyticus]SNR61800.1 peptidyl-dipeptidase Dcp [Lutibacter agarilyticus]